MPKNKDLKRLARSRMQKTGESYSTARSKIVQKKARSKNPPDFAKLAGMSDKAVRERTGRNWQQWVRALDERGASSMRHRQIAAYVYENFDVSGWWAQTVTVGYERIRGLREIGQRRGGAYEMSKSKTLPVSVSKLYRAFSVARTRARFLPASLTVRYQSRDKTMRLNWEDATTVAIYFLSKGPEKSQVTVQHLGLKSKADSEAKRAYWGERLNALSELLGEKRSR